MLNGTMIKLANGALAIECSAAMHNEPKTIRHVWRLDHWKVRGMCWKSEAEAIGRPATIRDGRVSCYLGEGAYLEGALPELGQTKAISVEVLDVPRPKVRAGTELRWYNSRWEKYNARKGWIAA